MIRAFLALLARTLIEFGLLFFLVGSLILFLSFRLVRRLTVGGEDTLESYSRPLMHLASAVAELVAVAKTRS